MTIDYAAYGGIQSLPAAIVFALLYVPLEVWYIRTLFHNLRRYVIVLTLFCNIRITSFIIRAVLAGNSSAAQNLSLYIAEQVLVSIGYFTLLFSAYTLVMDRTDIIKQHYLGDSSQQFDHPPNVILGLVQNRHLFRIAMMVAVILSIVGSSSSSNSQSSSTLRTASVIIFLVLTALQILNALMLINLEFVDPGIRYPPYAPFGARNGSVVLLVISLLLLTREIFTAATLGNTAVYQNEQFWYPLVAVPELIAVALYLAPGLFPEPQPAQIPMHKVPLNNEDEIYN
ncbi:hypothetical protein M378DRAFT_622737 [Amanita muscaria Koide BX008]|uniref:DUF7702 domain-containing protein n=1 Tax=Amanita muscaria (strain Koide BX008) TaxID=946122 RepID=A0A0C2XMS3_AMAMK|nr:hypothetical protein M378DRAFT_622737 [Amanita muscaria Koide BX008]